MRARTAEHCSIPEVPEWSAILTRIARTPLSCCEQFPRTAKRFEAWWAHDSLDRPIFLASVNTNPARPITRRLDLIETPDAWFNAKRQDLAQTRCIGDSLPAIRADFGPVLLGGMLGGRLEFDADTAWTHAFINDAWSNAPDWELKDDNTWWRLLRELTMRLAADAPGNYLVCTPDLGASADILLNLRGANGLCMDVLLEPGRVCGAVAALFPAWHQAFTELYRITLGQGAGLIHWLGLWSNRPYVVPACDFNYLIAPEQFNVLFLPDIARQSGAVGRAVFHLDGPCAARHIDALLELPELDAIQFTPGEGAPSALAWVDMFRKVQSKRKSLLIICPAEEVLVLRDALRPEGLAIWVGNPKAATIDGLFEAFCRG